MLTNKELEAIRASEIRELKREIAEIRSSVTSNARLTAITLGSLAIIIWWLA